MVYSSIPIAVDENMQFSTSWAEGSLLDAKPGSALNIAIEMVLQEFRNTFPGWAHISENVHQSFLQFSQEILDAFFNVTDSCNTKEEFKVALNQECVDLSNIGSSTASIVGLIGGISGAGLPIAIGATVASISLSTFGSYGCQPASESVTPLIYNSRQLPLKIKMYKSRVPSLPIVFTIPDGSYSGACCTNNECDL